MKSGKHRAVIYALLLISLCSFVRHAGAQASPITPAEVSQIVDEALAAVVPPADSLSRVAVGKRKILFDYERTLKAFGLESASASRSDLALQAAVIPGSQSVLSDCNAWGEKPCARLGWRAYVWVGPTSIAASEAIVRVYVAWASRGKTPFKEGVEPTGKAYLVGMAAEVQLARSPNGKWKFVKRGNTMAGE